jgi:CRP-like cAMP-binding protein
VRLRDIFSFDCGEAIDLPNPLNNQLLAMLPAAEFAQLAKHLSTVELRRGETLALPDQKIRRVYFPHSGIVSFVVELSEGEAVQTGMIGRDGVIGAAQALDDRISLNKIVVQTPGIASVIDGDALLELVRAGSAIRKLIAAHEQFFTAAVQQTAACNAIHHVSARVSRWLLRMMDLIGPEIPITQEYLATMIGVRRTSVTTFASHLQSEGIISYARGQIHIADAERLKEMTCECHKAIQSNYERLFSRRHD